MKPSKPSTTAVCALHYAKLLIRLAIFITLLVLYVAAQPLCEADLRPNHDGMNRPAPPARSRQAAPQRNIDGEGI